jgi:hypothetical protein
MCACADALAQANARRAERMKVVNREEKRGRWVMWKLQ